MCLGVSVCCPGVGEVEEERRLLRDALAEDAALPPSLPPSPLFTSVSSGIIIIIIDRKPAPLEEEDQDDKA